MQTGLKVAEAMTVSPHYVPGSMTLRACAEEMDRRHVGAMLVKENEKLVGIITEQDIVRKAVAKGLNHDDIPVADVMETKLLTIPPDADVYKALIKMRDANIRHLPVVDGEEFLGLLTLKDILRIQPQLFELLVHKFELREQERKPLGGDGICPLCGNYTEKLLLGDEGAYVCEDCK